MSCDIKLLYEKFLEIKRMGWIESKRKGSTGVGYTFEELLNKPEENFPIPDFNGIEIKTCRKYTRRDIHLFTCTPDGDYLFPIKRIVKILGYPDKVLKDSKIFNLSFSGDKYTDIGIFKKGKIIVNRKEKKLDFFVIKNDGRIVNIYTSWSFEMLEEKLNLKLKYLARIIADSKRINDIEYFNYRKIKFYKLKDFDTFISLIENGYIQVCFNIGIFRDGNRKGKIHDRGVGFSINEKDINLLYDEINIE